MPKRRTRGSGSVGQLPSGRHRARWRDAEGVMQSETFTLKTDADKFLRRKLYELELARVNPPPPPPDLEPAHRLLGELIDEWAETVEHSVKPRTAERYEDHATVIRKHLGTEHVDLIGAKTLQTFVATLQQTYAPKTVRACHAVLMMILDHAHRMGDIDRLPPKPRLPRVERPTLTIPTRGQIDQLAAASDKRLWAPVILAGYCGLREGELLALLRSDVNLEERWLLVRHARNKTSGQTESTKTGRIRRVYLPGPVIDALGRHLAEYDGDLVVPVSASVYQKSFERARRACHLPTVRPHDLRHAAASMMIAAGLNVLQVSKQLGHANPTQTLDVYGHLWPDSFDDAMRRMDAYLAG